jgi:hypothetical protein
METISGTDKVQLAGVCHEDDGDAGNGQEDPNSAEDTPTGLEEDWRLVHDKMNRSSQSAATILKLCC